jgi:ketosteroid isomerase-like protein
VKWCRGNVANGAVAGWAPRVVHTYTFRYPTDKKVGIPSPFTLFSSFHIACGRFVIIMANQERSQLLKTAFGLIDAYNSWNMDAIMALRAPNCTQKIYPLRLKRPALNNERYRKYFEPFLSQFENYRINVLDYTEDPNQHKVAFHLTATSKTPVGDYNNEFAVYLKMTDDDRQIVEVKEFVDSGFSVPFFTKLTARM